MFKILRDSENKQHLYVDDKHERMVDISGLDYFVNNQITSKKLAEFYFKDFPPIANITFENYFDWCEIENYVFFAFDESQITEENSNLEELQIGIRPKLLEWIFFFSFKEYKDIFFDLLNSEDILGGEIVRFDEYEPSIDINFQIASSNLSIKEQIEPYEKLLRTVHEKTIELVSRTRQESFVSTIFDFPKEIKFSCEQFLCYFARFLQDLGINATSNLKEEAGKVLFSVTPTDDVKALDKIRETLAVYLNLPASPISDLEYSENFALMRLQQQVRNLQHSQQMAKTELLSAQYALSLAQSNFENQDQIIVRQHSTIENLNKVIEKITSNSIMTDSLDKKDKEEFEEIYEGLRVGESKWLRELTGFGLSSGKFVKALVKNTFGKEEKDSILGLGED